MMKIKSLQQTCFACPSQWEGELEDGRFIYIRYRWGNLGFGIGNTLSEAIENYNYGEDLGKEFDGVMETNDMLRHLGDMADSRLENEGVTD